MTSRFHCPVIGCPHYPSDSDRYFTTITHLIRHLKSDDHSNSRHLLDHTLCNKINLYRCTHTDCSSTKNIFYHSHRALTTHYTITHPLTCIPIEAPQSHTDTDTINTTNPYHNFTTEIFESINADHRINNWAAGSNFILSNYNSDPPHFRSTWRRFLDGNNKKRFNKLMATIIKMIVHSTPTNQSDIFWWLLFHIDMLILAPTPKNERNDLTAKQLISQRLRDLQCGNIEDLVANTTFNSNWNATSPRPDTRIGDTSAQIAADEDNYRTAISRACTFNKIATIDKTNKKTVLGLYPEPVPTNTNRRTTHLPNNQTLHLPGNICATIRTAGKHKGTGVLADSIDSFISLVRTNDQDTNNYIQQLFNSIYQGNIPKAARHFFSDTYLFCLHKDPNDNNKLRPIGIPSAIRRIIASHIAKKWKDRFALHLLPYNYAVGIPNGMDFIIKTMQLSIEKFIEQPQQRQETPSRAAIFVDLTNMFNAVSRDELFDIIKSDFPELLPLTSLLYEDHGTVKYKWKNKKWKQLSMKEGVNQGCPLSPIFATLVLHRVLKPLDAQLRQRATDRLLNGDTGDDGFGSLAHLFAFMDDISSTVHHQDIKFFCSEIEKLGSPRGCFINPHKTRILTSCSGASILPSLSATNHDLAMEVSNTIAKYSNQQNHDGTTTPIELTDGFRLLGTPIGSATFARKYFDEQLEITNEEASKLTSRIIDHQTRLKLFSQCTVNKLPHLLDADIMHNHTTEFDNEQWYNWNGHLTRGIDSITQDFFAQLLNMQDTDELPTYSTLLTHLNINRGGLGIINASNRAAPDFVINMMTCRRRSTQGFQMNKDITPITLHVSITNLYNLSSNEHSTCLSRYHQLLPYISSICSGPTCPPENRISHFESSISQHSARSRIKQFCGHLMTNQLYSTMQHEAPMHTHLLPSILSPLTAYPLIGMNRSNASNRLDNWSFDIAIKRKLRLPIFDQNNCPTCKCGRSHDPFGDHMFNCRNISKKMAHNIIRDSWATALQPALATAGYIRTNTKLDLERKNLKISDISAQPFDISFDPDPATNNSTHTPCPYSTIGTDITVTHCPNKPTTPDSSGNAAPFFSANADKHLQTVERKKLMRANRKPDSEFLLGLPGEQTIGELINENMVLIPIALDPFARLGPMAQNFLNLTTQNLNYEFPPNKPNARTMFRRATTHPCPIGILKTADKMWKLNKTKQFFGNSYTSPTPSIYTIQQLGLGITKAFSTHIRNATKSAYTTAIQSRQDHTESFSISSVDRSPG